MCAAPSLYCTTAAYCGRWLSTCRPPTGDIPLWTTEEISFDPTGALMTRLLLLHSAPPCISDRQVMWLRGTYNFTDRGKSLWDPTWRTGSYVTVGAVAGTNTVKMLEYLTAYCSCLGTQFPVLAVACA